MTTLAETPATKGDLSRLEDGLRDELRTHFATKEYVLRVNLTTAALIVGAVALIVKFLG